MRINVQTYLRIIKNQRLIQESLRINQNQGLDLFENSIENHQESVRTGENQ